MAAPSPNPGQIPPGAPQQARPMMQPMGPQQPGVSNLANRPMQQQVPPTSMPQPGHAQAPAGTSMPMSMPMPVQGRPIPTGQPTIQPQQQQSGGGPQQQQARPPGPPITKEQLRPMIGPNGQQIMGPNNTPMMVGPNGQPYMIAPSGQIIAMQQRQRPSPQPQPQSQPQQLASAVSAAQSQPPQLQARSQQPSVPTGPAAASSSPQGSQGQSLVPPSTTSSSISTSITSPSPSPSPSHSSPALSPSPSPSPQPSSSSPSSSSSLRGGRSMTRPSAASSSLSSPPPPPPPPDVKDIWSLLSESKQKEEVDEDVIASQREATLVFVGPQQSGKTSLIYSYMFKDKQDIPKSTTSLDYKFTRSSVVGSMSDDKSLSHFWEIGGGRTLDTLIDVPLNTDTIKDVLLVITLDLSKTSRVADDAIYWLEFIRKKLSDVIGVLKTKRNNLKLPALLEENARKRFGEHHADIRNVNLLAIPVLIVANKLDRLSNQSPENLKTLSKTLRSIAHSYGASLMYTSIKEKDSLKAFRNRISRHVLNSDKKSNTPPQVDPSSFLNVSSGSDSFASIGDAPISSSTRNHKDGWIAYFTKCFPPQESDADEVVPLHNLNLTAESTVDSMLAQKTEELTRLRNEVELKRKLASVDNNVTTTKR